MDPRADRRYFPTDDDNFDDAFDAPDEDLFMPGDRIGAPLPQTRSTMLSAAIALMIMAGGAWAVAATRTIWQPVLTAATVQTSEADVASRTVSEPQPVPALSESRDVKDAPGHAAGTPQPASETQAATAEASATETGSVDTDPVIVNAEQGKADDAEAESETAAVATERLPPPTIDPKDPLQKRALAAGLHPDLSRALLSRLTKTDFRNASTAINKALTEIGDRGVLVWPEQAPKKGAQFEVRFVAAGAESCRRYVVTVIRDRWSTTARPMEKCGDALPPRRVNRRASG